MLFPDIPWSNGQANCSSDRNVQGSCSAGDLFLHTGNKGEVSMEKQKKHYAKWECFKRLKKRKNQFKRGNEEETTPNKCLLLTRDHRDVKFHHKTKGTVNRVKLEVVTPHGLPTLSRPGPCIRSSCSASQVHAICSVNTAKTVIKWESSCHSEQKCWAPCTNIGFLLHFLKADK